MREALLKLVRMALRDGYLSDDLLELLDITESNMRRACPYCRPDICMCPGKPKVKTGAKGVKTGRKYPEYPGVTHGPDTSGDDPLV